MLLGYKKDTGNIEFLFTDTEYLKKRFPENTAKISNFWKSSTHGLTEYFTDAKQFTDYINYKNYKIFDNKIIKKTEEEIAVLKKTKKVFKNINPIDLGPNITTGSTTSKNDVMNYVKKLEDRIEKLEKEIGVNKNVS